MSEEQQIRRQAYLAELNQLARRYGFTVQAVIQTEQLNQAVVQVRAVVVVEPVIDWQAAPDPPDPELPEPR